MQRGRGKESVRIDESKLQLPDFSEDGRGHPVVVQHGDRSDNGQHKQHKDNRPNRLEAREGRAGQKWSRQEHR